MAGKRAMVKDGGGMGMGSIEKGSGYNYEMGGAPKKEKTSKANISMAIGKSAFVVRGGKKLPVVAEIGGKPFRLESGDRVETGNGSYVLGLTDVPTGDNPCTSISLYPNSAVEISTRHSSAGNVEGGADVITHVKFIEGMIMFSGPAQFEFKPSVPVKISPMMKMAGASFCAEMRQDGSVAFFNVMAEIEHTRTKVKAGIFAKETIATAEGLYCLPAVEPRYAEALKVVNIAMQAQAGAMGKKALAAPTYGVEEFKRDTQGAIAANVANMKKELAENEDLPREVVADYKRQIADYEQGRGVSRAFAIKDEAREKGLEEKRKEGVRRAITEGDAALAKLEGLRLPSPEPLDKKYLVSADKSERRTMSMDDYVRNAADKSAKIGELEALYRNGKITKTELSSKSKALQEEIVAPMKKQMEHNANAGKDGKPMADALLAKVKIGKMLQYGSIKVDVREAEKGAEFLMRKSKPGELFIIIGLKLENNGKSASTAYIVPDEEMWLSIGAGEPVKPENYKFETALDKGKPAEGYVYYTVPSDAKKFSLQLGKRKMEKMSVDFSL